MSSSPEVDPARPAADSSIGELISEVTRDLSTLVQQEVALAKAEVRESARSAGKGAGLFAGAAVATNLFLVFASVAAWWGLGYVIGHAWSALVVAVVWGLVAAVLALRGRAELRRVSGLPDTVDSVKKIPNALQGHEEKNR